MNYEPENRFPPDRSSSVLIRKQQLPAGERIGEYKPSWDDLGARRQSLDSSQCHQNQDKEPAGEGQDSHHYPDHGQMVMFASAHYNSSAPDYYPHL